MRDLELFSHWTFESFSPGSILRSKYNAFRQIHTGAALCFDLLARIEDCTLAERLVDWSKVCALTADLASRIRALADDLQVMDPVHFMDVHDWVGKIDFYARLATSMNVIESTPPYFIPFYAHSTKNEHNPWIPAQVLQISDPNTRGLLLAPSLFQYFLEANDVRLELDVLLRTVDPSKPLQLEQIIPKLQEIILSGTLPEVLHSELEIAALDIFSGQEALELWVFLGSDPNMHCLGCLALDRVHELAQAWLKGVALKYCREALLIRLGAGLADEEHEVTMVVLPAGKAGADIVQAHRPDVIPLLQRLESIHAHVTRLYLDSSMQLAHCRSLHDLVCLCLEHGLAQIFSFAGRPALGMGAIKRLRLEIPVSFHVFNLGGGLFPTAVEKTVVGMEDVRSTPAWSLLMGLTSTLLPWPGSVLRSDAHEDLVTSHSSYAVISQSYFYCTLRLGQNLFVVECDDGGSECEGYISFWFKGGSGSKTLRRLRLEIMVAVLKEEGFKVRSKGDYVQGTRDKADDVFLQRNLVCLGLLISWIQTRDFDSLSGSFQQGVQEFYTLVQQSMSSPP